MREMKDSGIEWIGFIPKSWNINKIKHNFSIISGATPKSENMDYWDGDIFWITPADFKTMDKYVSCGKRNLSQAGYNSCGTTLVPANSVIFSKRAPVGTVAVTTGELCTNQGCLSCVPEKTTNSLFYYYAMSVFTEQFELVSTGTTFKEISADVFANFYLPHPSKGEQDRIADYLDIECASVDAVIEQTRASIEEYKKLKQSVITQAVTKGIRPDRPMKDSGIEWIGDIPEEWGIGKAKYYITITNGSDPKTEGNIPVYGSGAKSFKTCGEYKEGPCVLIGRKGATLHIPHYIDHNYWNVDTAFDVKTKETYNLRFYYYTACCFDYKAYISQTTLPGMTQTNYENMFIPVPSLKEQLETVEWLDHKTDELDSLIDKKELFLTELESVKKSLIFEYITGKKEVPAC